MPTPETQSASPKPDDLAAEFLKTEVDPKQAPPVRILASLSRRLARQVQTLESRLNEFGHHFMSLVTELNTIAANEAAKAQAPIAEPVAPLPVMADPAQVAASAQDTVTAPTKPTTKSKHKRPGGAQ